MPLEFETAKPWGTALVEDDDDEMDTYQEKVIFLLGIISMKENQIKKYIKMKLCSTFE